MTTTEQQSPRPRASANSQLIAATAALEVEVKHLADSNVALARAVDKLADRVTALEKGADRRDRLWSNLLSSGKILLVLAGSALTLLGQWLLNKLLGSP